MFCHTENKNVFKHIKEYFIAISFFVKMYLLFYCVHVSMWVHVYHVCAGVYGGQTALDDLELNLPASVSCQIKVSLLEAGSFLRAVISLNF